MAKQKTVTLELNEIVSDRLQYKPYTARLVSPFERPILVDIPIDADMILEEVQSETVDGVAHMGYTKITVDGLAAVMGKVADAIEEMHDAYKAKK
jgi:hypothetical protein